MDRGFALARRSAFDGDLERAEQTLRALVAMHPNDGVVPAIRLFLARVWIALDRVESADREATATPVQSDVALTFTQRLVRGVVAARTNRDRDALALLRSLEGRLPDRSETAELSCALAEAEARGGDPGSALRAMAVIERAAQDGITWLPTGLSCEQPGTRAQLVERALVNANDPQILANTLDALPADSTLRRPIAVRLRTLASSLNTLAHWRMWLADAPDDAQSAPALVQQTGPPSLTFGIIAPMGGTRVGVGVAVVRGVQYALEGEQNVRVVTEDEGLTREDALGAIDRLQAAGVNVVVGVSREDHTPALAIRAQGLGLELWLLAPGSGIERTGPRVHLAGPTLDARVEAIAAAVRTRARNVTLIAPSDTGDLRTRLRELLARDGASVTLQSADDTTRIAVPAQGAAVVAGSFASEARASLVRATQRRSERWWFEARSVAPSTHGTWIGVAPGPALAALVARYCERLGEPPNELTLLAFDATHAALAAQRRAVPAPRALAPRWPILSAMVDSDTPAAGALRPAGAMTCP